MATFLEFQLSLKIAFCRTKTIGIPFEPPHGKTNNVVSEQVRHKPTCTVTEKEKLEISDLSRRGLLYYPSSENKGADQLRGYREADLRLCFRLCRLLVFP